jgi:hypothetical protein
MHYSWIVSALILQVQGSSTRTRQQTFGTQSGLGQVLRSSPKWHLSWKIMVMSQSPVPTGEHQNSWEVEVHPPKNGIDRYAISVLMLNHVKPLESNLIWFEASHFWRVSQLFLLKSLYLWVKSPFVWLASSHVYGFNSHSQLAQAQPLFWTCSGQIPYFTHCKPFWGSKQIIPWFERINIQLYCLFCCEQKGIPWFLAP